MSYISTEFNPDVFANKTLESITHSANTVGFNFSSDVLVTVLSSFSSQTEGEIARQSEPVPATSSSAITLVGGVVANATIVDSCVVAVEFENGDRLWFEADGQPYESYLIRTPDTEFAV
jgi:hypothetical protein